MEADVPRWADEERLEEVLLSQLVNVGRDINPGTVKVSVAIITLDALYFIIFN